METFEPKWPKFLPLPHSHSPHLPLPHSLTLSLSTSLSPCHRQISEEMMRLKWSFITQNTKQIQEFLVRGICLCFTKRFLVLNKIFNAVTKSLIPSIYNVSSSLKGLCVMKPAIPLHCSECDVILLQQGLNWCISAALQSNESIHCFKEFTLLNNFSKRIFERYL